MKQSQTRFSALLAPWHNSVHTHLHGALYAQVALQIINLYTAIKITMRKISEGVGRAATYISGTTETTRSTPCMKMIHIVTFHSKHYWPLKNNEDSHWECIIKHTMISLRIATESVPSEGTLIDCLTGHWQPRSNHWMVNINLIADT